MVFVLLFFLFFVVAFFSSFLQELPAAKLAMHATTLVGQLRAQAAALFAAAATASVVTSATAASAARLVRLVSQVFSADNTPVEDAATQSLAEVVAHCLTGMASTQVCRVVAPGQGTAGATTATARDGAPVWMSPAALVVTVVTPAVLRRLAASGCVPGPAHLFATIMRVCAHPNSRCSATCRQVLAALDLRLCDVPGFVASADLASATATATATAAAAAADGPRDDAAAWASNATALLEVLAANLTQGAADSPSLTAPTVVAGTAGTAGGRGKKRGRGGLKKGSTTTTTTAVAAVTPVSDARAITDSFVAPLMSIVTTALATQPSREGGSMVSATVEYVAQLVFTSLQHVVEALSTRVPANNASVARALDVGKILQCIEDSSSLETRSLGLLVVARVAQLLPRAVVRHLLPMLACLGRSSLHLDDSYSFYVVQQIIEAVVPALHSHGASAGLSGFSLVGAFVDKVDTIPAHRRTALFHSVVVSLGATRDASPAAAASYLYAVVTLLLCQTPDHAAVCHSLFSRFTGAQQASSLAQLLNVCRRALLEEAASSSSSSPSSSPADDDDTDMAAEEDRNRSASIDATAVAAEVATGMTVPALLAQISLGSKRSSRELLVLLTRFVDEHLPSDAFLASTAAASASDEHAAFRMQKAYLMLAQQLFQLLHLCQLDDVVPGDGSQDVAMGGTSGDGDAPSALLFGVLEKLGELMTMSTLLVVVTELLGSAEPLVGRYALRFFNNTIETRKDSMSAPEISLLLDLLKELESQLASAEEAVLNKQTALLTVEIVCRHFGEFSPDAFVTLLPHVVALAAPPAASGGAGSRSRGGRGASRSAARRTPSTNTSTSTTGSAIKPAEAQALRSTALLTLATCVSQLGPKTLPHLPKFMPSLLTTLEARPSVAVSIGTPAKKAAPRKSAHAGAGAGAGAGEAATSQSEADTRAWVLHSALVSLAVVTERLPQFLSPFLRRVLRCTLHRASVPITDTAEGSTAPAAVRQAAGRVLAQLTANVAARTLLPEFIAAYGWCCAKGPGCLSRMLLMLKDVFVTMTTPEVVTHHSRCFNFLMQAMDYRRTYHSKVPAAAVSSVEDSVTQALVTMVLKMSESQLKPMFVRVCNWVAKATVLDTGAAASTIQAQARRIAFFRLCEAMVMRLRSIFVPYFGCVGVWLACGGLVVGLWWGWMLVELVLTGWLHISCFVCFLSCPPLLPIAATGTFCKRPWRFCATSAQATKPRALPPRPPSSSTATCRPGTWWMWCRPRNTRCGA